MTLATMPTFSSITTAISSRIAVWPDRCHSLMKLSVLSSRPNSAQSRVPARRNRWLLEAVRLEHEGVAQHLADGGRLDVGALRRKPLAAALVPIFEQLAVGRVFHFVPPVALFARRRCPRSGHAWPRAVRCLRGRRSRACAAARVLARLCRRASRVSVKSGSCVGSAARRRRRVAAANPRGVGDVTEREGQSPPFFFVDCRSSFDCRAGLAY